MIETAPLKVGDLVELVDALPGRTVLPIGSRGTVLVTGLPFHACTVEFGERDGQQLRQVREVHLRVVERE